MELRLKEAVERIVRPIRADEGIKNRLREELWSHAQGIYDEERKRCENDAEAYLAAIERLGDPATIRRDFVRSLALHRRVFGWAISHLGLSPGKSIHRKAFDGARLGFELGFAVTLVLVVWAFAFPAERGRLYGLYVPTENWQFYVHYAIVSFAVMVFQTLMIPAVVYTGAWQRKRLCATHDIRLHIRDTALALVMVAVAAGGAALIALVATLAGVDQIFAVSMLHTTLFKEEIPMVIGTYCAIVTLGIPTGLFCAHHFRSHIPDWPYALPE